LSLLDSRVIIRRRVSGSDLGKERKVMVRIPLLLAFPGMAAIAVALAVTLGPLHSHVAGGQALGIQQGDFELAIDANVENGNGPCDPIDSEADANVGATHRVAVCILNPPEPPSSFLTRVVYNGQLNKAPESLPHVLPCLDDNPDANAGATTFSSPSLGERWDCCGMGIYPPRGDDEYTPDKNDAVLACYADLRNPDATLVQGGPLEVITFEVVGGGDDRIEFDPTTAIGGATGTIGTCGEVPTQTIPCHGAVIHKQGEAPPATPPPAASPAAPTPSSAASAAAPTPERKATVTPGGATPAAAGGTPESDEGGGFPWAVVGGALGGAALLIVVLGGLYTWSRASRRRP
jgi:hypothetical protein